MTLIAADLLRRFQQTGIELRIVGDKIHFKGPMTNDLLAELRHHKPEILAALQAQSSPEALKLYGWRQIALAALQAAISDGEERALIIREAQRDAASWRFLGREYVDHIFSNNIIDEIERRTNRITCYLGGAERGPDGEPMFTGFSFRTKT
jgi:TubC N-terminal docking domain